MLQLKGTDWLNGYKNKTYIYICCLQETHFRPKDTYRQIILQSYSHQDSMVVAQKQKYRPMEQDRNPEIDPCTYG